ncbi:hypothetical protein, partial [Flavobacterium sp. HTF]|uniref:hypothetical protein n=1 Tax=Flavobacterium sp. HTF TaxID=2170732 RepID=UPI000D5DB322
MKTNFFIFLIILFCNGFMLAQQKTKDTLFFKYDKKYIKTYDEIPKHYYIDEISNGNNGIFFFKEINIFNNIKEKKILSLKKFVRNLNVYDKNHKIDDYELAGLFNKNTVFLVRSKN